MFDGRDYAYEFESVSADLVGEADLDVVKARLASLEWVLAEAFKAVLFYISIFVVLVPVLLIGFFAGVKDASWTSQFIIFGLAALAIALVYGLSRFILWYEIGRHVRPRRFGGLIFD